MISKEIKRLVKTCKQWYYICGEKNEHYRFCMFNASYYNFNYCVDKKLYKW